MRRRTLRLTQPSQPDRMKTEFSQPVVAIARWSLRVSRLQPIVGLATSRPAHQ